MTDFAFPHADASDVEHLRFARDVLGACSDDYLGIEPSTGPGASYQTFVALGVKIYEIEKKRAACLTAAADVFRAGWEAADAAGEANRSEAGLRAAIKAGLISLEDVDD